MAIKVERIRADIEAIARCTQTPGEGATRPTFSPAWAAARDYVIAQAEAAGCSVRTDAAGNVHARPKSVAWETPAWLVGSHIDTVPHGGDYDGVAGVVVALEILRAARDENLTGLPVELIVFAEEEGPTFGLGMLGSRAWVGELTGDQLGQLKNAAGQTYLEAGKPYGVDPVKLEIDGLIGSRYLGLLEVHIEQGPGMWKNGVPLAVVTDIAGRRQYKAKFMGVPNHAGSTAMGDRTDALVPAARVIAFVEEMARGFGGATVATVGYIECSPNAVNVVPGTVRFTIDFRSPDAGTLAAGHQKLEEFVIHSAGIGNFNFLTAEEQPPVPMDARLCRRLSAAAEQVLGHPVPTAISGALHDSAILAPHLPTIMLFVPSRDGISHNPAEFSRVEDIAAAAAVVENLIRRPAPARLSAMEREAFVAICGPLFEHSPWIAERAWRLRPFASASDLHEKLCAVVASATPEEQLSLIRAHPDLVGRLAREGRLTRESTAEQAAAGLTALSEQEAAQFERYNQAYREKFSFPFVICARENKKEAILAAFPQRLQHDRDREVATALQEIYKIARLRLADAIWED
jgi:allantoate deiminase